MSERIVRLDSLGPVCRGKCGDSSDDHYHAAQLENRSEPGRAVQDGLDPWDEGYEAGKTNAEEMALMRLALPWHVPPSAVTPVLDADHHITGYIIRRPPVDPMAAPPSKPVTGEVGEK